MSAPTSPGRWTTLSLSAVVAVFFLVAENGPYSSTMVVATWAAVCLAAGALWHRSPDERSPITMAFAAHLAAVLVLPPLEGLGVVFGSSLLGGLIWRREGMRDLLIETGSSMAAAVAAQAVVVVVGRWIPLATLARDPQGFVTLGLAGFAAVVVYQAVLSLAMSRVRRLPWGRAWWEAFGRETGLVTSGALLTVAALAVFGAQTLGIRGILLAAMPALFVRDGSRRNIDLEIAQGRLIKNERLAAKGEMAAEIGHELNNYLAAISGRAQLLLRKLEARDRGALGAEAERIRSLSMDMAELSRGLMEFSHRGVRREAVGVNELVERTVEFVRPQKKFRNLDFRLEPDPALPRVEMDPGQIQQVLLILLAKAVEGPKPGTRGVLLVRTFGTAEHGVGIEIGSPHVRPPRSEEPEIGDEPAIDTVRRILGRHHGRLEIAAHTENIGSYRVLLPAA